METAVKQSGRQTCQLETGVQYPLPVGMYELTNENWGFRGYLVCLNREGVPNVKKYFSAKRYGSYKAAYLEAFKHLISLEKEYKQQKN